MEGSKSKEDCEEQSSNDSISSVRVANSSTVPFITPINEPKGEDDTSKARMTNLLYEEPSQKLMSEEERGEIISMYWNRGEDSKNAIRIRV